MNEMSLKRRLPVGAEVSGEGVHFRVWAPKRERIQVVFEDPALPPLELTAESGGYFSGIATRAKAGTLYSFRLDGEEKTLPDAASRFQPHGVQGPSMVVDPSAYAWRNDAKWQQTAPPFPAGVVLYEMHIGTFPRVGSWTRAIRELPGLAELGVNCLEVMPVCDFAGNFGWGYDGVDFFAPTRLYGSADDFRRFVDEAHGLGIGVILDVVYNHFGPDGNDLPAFSDDYTSTTHKTDWGGAVNFAGKNARGVREFFLANQQYWVEEFHIDGYRYDATQAIVDDSPVHILAEMSDTVRRAGGAKKMYLINENEPQHTRIARPIHAGGYGMDALWNDDFHHSAMVAVTGRNEAYYTDHYGKPQEFISAAKWGYLFQGQRYSWQKNRRGTPALDLPPTAFVSFIQNHDQIANSGTGMRVCDITSPGELRAMTALMILSPQTPMLFMGQEFAASTPFHYFADHHGDLGELVCKGRAREVSQFPSMATPEVQAHLPNPCKRETFEKCKLDHAEKTQGHHARVWILHRDLIRLRKEEPTMRRVQKRGDIDGAVLSDRALVLRFFGSEQDDRLLVVNFGTDLNLPVAPEPLLAPPDRKRWGVLWSSEHPKYGGSGTPPPDTENEGWFLPGRAAIVLKPVGKNEGVETRRAVG
jgi:maltooligosyltrehalose trehalohydrolase